MRYSVDIKVLFNDTVDVDLPATATRQEVVDAAKAKYEKEGSHTSEYGGHVFDNDTWTITNEDGEYIGAVRGMDW